MKVLFVNENIGGHSTTHLHLRRSLVGHPQVRARFLDVPPPGLGRKLLGAPVPGLARHDLDLQPLRSQLALSRWTHGRLAALAQQADVVHVFTHNAVLLSSRLLSAVPTVVALDGTNAMNAYSLPYREPTRFTPWTVAATKVFERRVHAAADLVVATSEVARRSLAEDYSVAPDRIRVIPYGIEAPEFPGAAAPGTRPSGLPRLVFVGRGLERKGGNRLVRLHQERLVDRCELVLVTPDEVHPARNVTVVRDVRPGDARLWEVLRRGAVFVFPSRIDQQPNVVMEALAAGLPVVAYAVNATAEMVVDGVTGLVPVDTGDDALVAAIERLLDDGALRVRLGAHARAHFEERFSASVTTGRVLDTLREAVARHSARDTA